MGTAAKANRKRVLIIDDSADMRLIARRFLEKVGYLVEDLQSADGLDEALVRFSPDLILCDMMMPGQDGLAVCRRLRADPHTFDIPLIVFSAKSFEADQRAALDAGATAYLVKPMEPESLRRAVAEALSTEVSVKVWGCRGSVPAPEQAVGSYGGNTSCIELTLPQNRRLIFDAGTGIRALGNRLVGEPHGRLTILLTHFHWDHIQGLPFFKPLYVPQNEIRIYGPAESDDALLKIVAGQMGGAFFPVGMDSFRSSVAFVGIQQQSFELPDIPGITLSTLWVNHPGRTLAYRVNLPDRVIVYCPDDELFPEVLAPKLSGFALDLKRFIEGAALLLHDCQYASDIYPQRRVWGHSCAVNLAAVVSEANVKRVLLFHHDPDNDDQAIESIHREFQNSLKDRGVRLESEPAREGGEYQVE